MEILELLRSVGIAEDELQGISKAFISRKYPMDTIIFNEGDPSDSFHFIQSGRALITRKSTNGSEEFLNILKEGQCFGEIGIIQNINRTATVKALGEVELLEIDNPTFRELSENNPSFMKLVKRIGIQRLLRHISLFKDLDEDSLKSVQDIIVEASFHPGKIIFEEGDMPDALYIILTGEVKIYKKNQFGKNLDVSRIGNGDFFGEQGLIDSMPRSASAMTTEETRFLLIHTSQFRELLKKHAMISFNILKVLSQRIRSTTREMSAAKSVSYFNGMTIISRPDRCLSCKTCEIACAVAKSNSLNLYDAINETPLPVKRIHVRSDKSGSEPLVRPEHCTQCKAAPCLTSCKFDAIFRNPETRTIQIVPEKCVGCGLCSRACPFNVITIVRGDAKKRVALKCTYCQEHQAGPACVRSCPTNALVVALTPGSGLEHEL